MGIKKAYLIMIVQLLEQFSIFEIFYFEWGFIVAHKSSYLTFGNSKALILVSWESTYKRLDGEWFGWGAIFCLGLKNHTSIDCTQILV